jgi:hypothetical protein
MSWLLIRLTDKRHKKFNRNKAYAAEVLSDLLKWSEVGAPPPQNQKQLGSFPHPQPTIGTIFGYSDLSPGASRAPSARASCFGVQFCGLGAHSSAWHTRPHGTHGIKQSQRQN